MVSNIKYALFDFDGTLAMNCTHVSNCYIYCQKYFNLRIPSHQELMDLQGLSFEETRERLGCPEEFHEKYTEIFWIEMADFEKEGYQAFLLPFVVETLKMLKAKNIPIGIVTANHAKIVEKCAKALGISQFIDFYVGSENCEEVKPSPKPLLFCLEKLGGDITDLSNVIYVGDSKTDLKAGINTNVAKTFIVVSQDHFERRFLDDIQTGKLPELGDSWTHFESMENLLELVAQL